MYKEEATNTSLLRRGNRGRVWWREHVEKPWWVSHGAGGVPTWQSDTVKDPASQNTQELFTCPSTSFWEYPGMSGYRTKDPGDHLELKTAPREFNIIVDPA